MFNFYFYYLEKLNSNQYDQTSNFVSLNRKAEIHKCNLINSYVKVKRKIRKFEQNKLHPDKDPEYIINQIVCLHNMFYNWANVSFFFLCLPKLHWTLKLKIFFINFLFYFSVKLYKKITFKITHCHFFY